MRIIFEIRACGVSKLSSSFSSFFDIKNREVKKRKTTIYLYPNIPIRLRRAGSRNTRRRVVPATSALCRCSSSRRWRRCNPRCRRTIAISLYIGHYRHIGPYSRDMHLYTHEPSTLTGFAQTLSIFIDLLNSKYIRGGPK